MSDMDNTADFVVLHGTGVSLLLEISATAAPVWRYWGARLDDAVVDGLPAIAGARPTPSFSLDTDQPLSLFPTFGLGWFGQSALLAHRDGADYAQAVTGCSMVSSGAHTVVFTMIDAVAMIEIILTLSLDPMSDTLSLSTRLTNRGEAGFDVQWLAAGTVPLPIEASVVRSYSGRHNHEFMAVDDTLSASIWRRENRRGISSHDCFPGAVVRAGDLSYGAQLAWSGNHVQTIERGDDGRYLWQMGAWLAPGEVRLGAGEWLETPEMLLTCSNAGLNGVAQNFHANMRSRVVWPGGSMRPRPVHLNTWEALYFDHDEEALKALASSAAALGIERFVLDDGWFHRRHNDRSSLGDWWVDAVKYPNGLAPLADHVTGLGMEFGLWVEPEMVNPDSALFRAHPDWALHIMGRPLVTGRNQLVLDMSRPEVTDYVFDKIAALLETLPISYLKWDHNRDLATAGATPKYRRQVQATYDLMARIRTSYPAVEIESCAGGGGRIDAGMVRFVHRFWASDCIDAVSRVAIQRGFLQFMPPELMGAHIGTSPAHSSGRSQSMDFRAAVAMPGHLGVELDVRNLGDAERASLKRWITAYKAARGQLHRGKVWMGEAGDGLLWQAHGDADALWLWVYRLAPTGQRHTPALRLPMLDPSRHYLVTTEFGGAKDDMPVRRHGSWLVNAGLALPEMKAESCVIYRMNRATL